MSDRAEVAEVIERAIAELDLATKVGLLTGAAAFALAGNEQIGLRPLVFSDGPTGVRGADFLGGQPVALFPNATLLAQSWDETAADRVGGLLAGEGRGQHVDVVLGPTVNLHRTPLGGRLFEAYSEDPLLSGRLAAAYVRGIQRYGIAACVKHYLANESETERHTMNSQVSEAALRECYLLPFEICIDDANPWTIMAAYNDVNGVAATEHDELNNRLLKGEWGWDGLLMSDWSATKTTVPSANGGLDLIMPGPRGPWGEALVAAVEAGEVAESVINDHLARLLRLAGRVGGLHGVPSEATASLGAPVEPTDPELRLALRNLAADGMVLLKGAGVLPLDPAAITEQAPLVLVGRHAVATALQGGGSASVRPPHEITIAAALTEELGADRLRVLDGVAVRRNPPAAASEWVSDPETGAPGVRFTSLRADGQTLASVTSEVAETMLGNGDSPHDGAAFLQVSARIEAADGTAVRVGVRGVGDWTLTYGERTETFTTEEPGDSPELGFMQPPSWTTVVEADAAQTLVAKLTVAGRFSLAGLIVEAAPPSDDDLIALAAAAAADAPTAVVVVGTTPELETEAIDKTTLTLPGRQDELVSAVAAAARRTVVIVNAATPALMPWLDEVDAVLWIGLPGQEGGYAVADVLVGRAEPSGRLVTTFPAADGDGPAWSTTPVDGTLEYTDGTALGYRGWFGGHPEPLFWFGEGLGWGEWDYRSAAYEGDEDERVTVVLANRGQRPSREVVQVYWQPDGEAPVRLVGWAIADEVVPNEQRTVTVDLDPRALRLWDEDASAWTRPAGGTLLIARGLGDVRLEVPRG